MPLRAPFTTPYALTRTVYHTVCPYSHPFWTNGTNSGRTGILTDKRAYHGLHQLAPGKGRLSEAASSRPTMSDRWPAASGSEFKADETADRIRMQQ